jgi:hypothetical protein
MKFALFVLSIGFVTPAVASDPIYPTPRHYARVKSLGIACASYDDFRRYAKLSNEGEVEAAGRFARSHDCTTRTVGVAGFVERTSAWTDAACLRPQGGEECYWIGIEHLSED